MLIHGVKMIALRNSLHILCLLAVCVFVCSCSDKPRFTDDELLKNASDAGAKGNWKDASSLAGRVVKHDPRNVNALVIYAMALENSNHPELALDEIKKAATLAPNDFMVQFSYGRMLFKQGRYGEALTPLKAASECRHDDIDTIILLAQCSNKLKLPEAANYYALAATNLRFKDKPEPFNEIGMIYYRNEDYERALRYFIKAYKTAPENHITCLNLAICLDKTMNDPGRALAYYKKFIKLTEKNPEIEARRKKVSERINEIEPEPKEAPDPTKTAE